jgi:cytochrome c biogenesis protein CcmG/thiol:disulfide interchange protein DsbE
MRAAILIALTAAAAAWAQAPVPRPATELTIQPPGGPARLLSSYRGKVVVVQFLSTGCPHCQRLSQDLTALAAELGPGVQMLGVAFDNANDAMVEGYVRNFGVGFPVAHADRAAVFGYLGLNETQRIGVPQVVVIDRRGRIRAQTDAEGGGDLGRPAYLRSLLGKLLAEP